MNKNLLFTIMLKGYNVDYELENQKIIDRI